MTRCLRAESGRWTPSRSACAWANAVVASVHPGYQSERRNAKLVRHVEQNLKGLGLGLGYHEDARIRYYYPATTRSFTGRPSPVWVCIGGYIPRMTWSSKRRIAGFLVCVAGLGAAGGGSSHSSNVSQAAFEAGATSVCAKFNGQENLGSARRDQLAVGVVLSGQGGFHRSGRDQPVEGFGNPRADQSKLSGIYTTMQDQVAQARQLAGTVEAGNLAPPPPSCNGFRARPDRSTSSSTASA